MSNYGFSIRSDDRRNVMYIEQHGQPTAADFLDLKRAFLSEVVNLHQGFSIINDQRKMEPYDDEAMEVAVEIVRIVNEYRASRVIRIVPVDFLSIVRLSTTLEAARSQYTSIRVSSPEEAEEALDALSENPDF